MDANSLRTPDVSLRFVELAEEGDEFPVDLDGEPVVEASVTVLVHAFCNSVKAEPVGDFGRGESGESEIDFVS